MAIVNFPPVNIADENGLLAIGGDLEIPSLILAYQRGIFPWPISEDTPLAWFCPDPRGVLEYKDMHLPSSLKKLINKNKYEIRFNTNFEAIIMNCAKVPRKNQTTTWITQQVIDGYINLFKEGYAYSCETYLNDRLVGGVYGVSIDGIVTGESMYYLEPNASKVALVAIMEKINSAGIEWLDTQMVTPVVETLGGKEIPRDEFIDRLKKRKQLSRDEIFTD